MKAKIFNHKTGEVRELDQMAATETTRITRGEWSFSPPPPRNWEREIPMYQASRALVPAARDRVKQDPPWESCSNPDCWQYADRPIKAGEVVSTTSWPHEFFRPINYAAERVLEYYISNTRSRLQRSPWLNDRIRLDDGLSGSLGPIGHHAFADQPRA